MRRVVLHAMLAPEERFDIDGVDALALNWPCWGRRDSSRPPPTRRSTTNVLVYDKPGYVVGDDCVDVAYIDDLERSQAFLLGVSTPDDGQECQTLTDVAQGTLAFLETL